MSKKIHTIQSSDKKEFDKTVNQFLESGGELMDNGYQVINSDDGLIYSQVIVLKNCDVEFYEDGQLKSVENKNEDGEWDGLQTKWDKNGQKTSEGNYNDGEKDGLQTWWYENGQKRWEDTYKDGKQDGLWTMWWENGQKLREGIYKDGELDGLSTYWYENGQKGFEEILQMGEMISKKEWNEDGSVKE